MINNKKIKVLLCSPSNNTGGISKWTSYILNYYKQYEKSDIDLKWIYSKPTQRNIIEGTNIFIRIYYGFIKYIPFIKNLNKELKKNRYDIVHFTTSASISLFRDFITLKICSNNKTKTVIHFHFGRIPEIFIKNNWECKLIKKVLDMTNKGVVIDQKSYNTLIKYGYSNIELLPNPLSPLVDEIILNNLDIQRIDRKIVYVGHLVPSKGVFELINVCKDIPNIKLKMLGICTDEMRDKLLEKAGFNNENWLEIVGDQSFDNVIKEMLSANVFVLPTYSEGFPNVIIESMACGCPIVTTKVGAIPEMLDIENGEQNGLCVEPKNIEQLHSAIEKMLNDPEFARQCGNNAQKRVNEMYSIPKIWSKLLNIWEASLK